MPTRPAKPKYSLHLRLKAISSIFPSIEYILDINLTGVHLNEETLPQNVGEVVKEEVTGWARGCTNIIYTNDVQVAPTEATN